jgi:hypothetical protein
LFCLSNRASQENQFFDLIAVSVPKEARIKRAICRSNPQQVGLALDKHLPEF